MPDFNSMTISSACRLLEWSHRVATLDSLLIEWGVYNEIPAGSKPKKLTSLAILATSGELLVPTERGKVNLARAIIEAVVGSLSSNQRSDPDWKKLVVGLRMDGFEICEVNEATSGEDLSRNPIEVSRPVLRRMLPSDAPELDFREAESELITSFEEV